MIENEDPQAAAVDPTAAPEVAADPAPTPEPSTEDEPDSEVPDEDDLLADIRAHIEALMGTDVAAMVEKALAPFEERLRRLEVGMKHFL